MLERCPSNPFASLPLFWFTSVSIGYNQTIFPVFQVDGQPGLTEKSSSMHVTSGSEVLRTSSISGMQMLYGGTSEMAETLVAGDAATAATTVCFCLPCQLCLPCISNPLPRRNYFVQNLALARAQGMIKTGLYWCTPPPRPHSQILTFALRSCRPLGILMKTTLGHCPAVSFQLCSAIEILQCASACLCC